MQSLKLTDLIDISILQKVQEAFSEFTQMASLIADENGVPITVGSSFTRFCTELTRKSELGYQRCRECDRNGGMTSLKTGRPSVYQCHAGLCDFAAPIIVDGYYIGCLMGGQILTKPLDRELITLRAAEYGIDEQEYLNAAMEVKLKDEEDVLRAAEFIFKFAGIISEMAYTSYKALKTSRNLEKAACTQASFIIDMNSDLQKNMKDWILMAGRAAESDDLGTIREATSTFIDEGRKFLSSIEDTVEYVKMTDGEIELNEEEYNVRDKFGELLNDNELSDAGRITLDVSENVPELMFGDVGRIRQAVIRLIQHIKGIAPDGDVKLGVSCPHCSYAAELEITIGTTEQDVSSDEIHDANNSFNSRHKYLTGINPEDVALTVTGRIIRQMHGSVNAAGHENSGLEFVIRIPQLAVSAE